MPRAAPIAALVATALAAAAAPAAAEPPSPAAETPAGAPAPAPGAARRALAIGAAIVPGAVVRGAGHWALGERRPARRLLLAQGAGVALAAAGLVPIGVSGGAEELLPGMALAIPGVGLLAVSWLADVYGAAGGGGIGGRPERAPVAVELEVGATWVADPQVDAALLATFATHAWIGRARVDGDARLGGAGWRARGGAAVRLAGGRPGAPARDGTRLDVRAAIAEERAPGDGFSVTVAELAAAGRWDLARADAALAGAFATLELGIGSERIRFAGGAADRRGVPLARFGFGVDLGDGGARHAEVEAFYDHRRDDLAGGLLLASGANGFLGKVGVAGRAWRGAWGLAAGVEVGSAWVAHLGVRHRSGGAW